MKTIWRFLCWFFAPIDPMKSGLYPKSDDPKEQEDNEAWWSIK